ncbi:MAG: hypothetical protein ACI9OJ_002079 [Myxococcota bacterium]|jgi:hypothetical protein
MTNGAEAPTISALGDIVTFQKSFNPAGLELHYRDRPAGLTQGPTPIAGVNARVSDDGCVIAYSRPRNISTVFITDLVIDDRCNPANSLTIGQVGPIRPAPGVNVDGSVVAYSVGTQVLVWRRDAAALAIPAPVTSSISTFGVGDVALSSDGNVLAFVSGPLNTSGNLDFAQSRIWVVDVPAGAINPTPVVASQTNGFAMGSSSNPTVSSDGSLIGFRYSGGVDSKLGIPGSGIFVADRADPGNSRLVLLGGGRPSISRDGRYMAFEIFAGDNSDVYATRTDNRWLASTGPELVSYPQPSSLGQGRLSTNAVVSEHGRWVAWEARSPDIFVTDALFPSSLPFPMSDAIIVRQRRPVLTVESADFGQVAVSAQRDVVIRNVGPSGWRVTSIETTGEFAVAGQTCGALLQPGDSCVVTVRFSPTGPGAKNGELIVRDRSYPGIPLAASGRLVGLGQAAGIEITPNPVGFDEMVVSGPAVVRAATVTNVGNTSLTVESVGLSGPDVADFTITNDACTALLLAVDESCEVELAFAATAVGDRVATLDVAGSTAGSAPGSALASAALTGAGRFDAVLMVSPLVAAGGQVVSVTGSGYPASTDISVVLGDAAPIVVTSDGDGTFLVSWLILSGVPQGELLADDVAVVGVYDADPAPLQVTGTPVRPQATVSLSQSRRNLVSR